MAGWIIQSEEGDNGEVLFWIAHKRHVHSETDADRYVKVLTDVYLSVDDHGTQVQRLADLFNRIAPDGVLPDDEASS